MAETHISSSELARSIGKILGRLRFRGERFVIERNGTPVALLTPIRTTGCGLGEVLEAWVADGKPDEDWARLLEQVGETDTPAHDPGESR